QKPQQQELRNAVDGHEGGGLGVGESERSAYQGIEHGRDNRHGKKQQGVQQSAVPHPGPGGRWGFCRGGWAHWRGGGNAGPGHKEKNSRPTNPAGGSGSTYSYINQPPTEAGAGSTSMIRAGAS